MAGIFEIHPAGGTTIICDTLDTIGTAEHLLMSVDLKEDEREKILYSEGRFNGSVINSTASIVTAEFEFLINGNTPEEIASNVAALKVVFFNFKGGSIEYRPVGYSSSVLSTFYKYLRSAPPQRVNEEVIIQPSSEYFALGQMYRFQIKIFSLATSDPANADTTITSGTVWTYTDTAEPGYLVLDAADIKGDGLFPIISLEASGVSIKEAVVAFYEMEAGNEDKDWYLDGYSGHPNLLYSDAEGFYVASEWLWWVTWDIQVDTRAPFGRVAPIFSYKRSGNTLNWDVQVAYSDWMGTTLFPITDRIDIPAVATLGEWYLFVMDSITMPPVPYPNDFPLSDMNLRIGLIIREKAATVGDELHLSGLLLAPVEGNAWIAQLDGNGVNMQGQSINSIEGTTYEWTGGAPKIVMGSWIKRGMSAKDAIMPKGTYQIRHVSKKDVLGYYHDTTNKLTVSVEGIFYTIYPFSEA